MRITPARVEDAGCLTDICVRATRQYGYDDETIERFRPALAVNLVLIAAGLTFVASDDSGTAFGVVAPRPTQYGGLALLDRVFVDPSKQGAGAGRSLFAKAISQAAALDAAAMLIYAHPRAEGFYSRLGAQRIGKVPFYLSTKLLLSMMICPTSSTTRWTSG
jgi:predicted N-acetyltransferase YhbS